MVSEKIGQIIAGVLLVALGASGAYIMGREFKIDVLWQGSYEKLLTFGGDCEAAIQSDPQKSDFESLAANVHAFKPVAMPYKKMFQTGEVKVPQDGYLITRCQVPTDKLAADGYAVLRLAHLFGDSAVFVNGSLRLTQKDDGIATIPLTPADRKGKAELIIVSRPGPPTYAAGLVSNDPPFVTDDRSVIEKIDLSSLDPHYEIPLFRWALGLGLSLLFVLVWLFGLRGTEVTWMVCLASALTLQNAIWFKPIGRPEFWQRQTFGILEALCVAALAGFSLVFLRSKPKRAWFERLLFGFVAVYSLGHLVLPRAWATHSIYRLSTPYGAGGILLATVAVFAIMEGYQAKAGERRRPRVIAALAGVAALAYAVQIYASFYGIVFVDYVKICALVIFAGWFGSDLVLSYKRLAKEQAARQEADLMARMTQVLIHDLQSPFSNIKMAFEAFIAASGSPEKVVRVAERLYPTVSGAMVDVDKMLDSAIDLWSPAERERTDFRLMVAEVLAQVKLAKPAIDLHVKVELDDLPVLLVNSGRVKRAIQNVIENAVDAMPNGGKIAFTWRPCKKSTFVEVTIWNDGEPVPTEVLPKIFDAFYSTKNRRASGLGLYGVKAAVVDHGGTINVTSDATLGTAFKVTLPVAPRLDATFVSPELKDGRPASGAILLASANGGSL